MKNEIEPISLNESKRLIELEKTIASGVGAFVEVGEALAEIRDSRLYRIDHSSFDDYLEVKWGISRSKASRLISAAETVRLLPIGNSPASESVVRPLSALPVEQRAPAFAEAVKKSPNGKPTAKTIRAVVDKVIPRETTPEPKASEPEAEVWRERCEAMVDENAELKRILDSVTTDDKAKEIRDVSEKFESSLGRIRQLHETHNEAVKQAKYYAGICDRLRKLLGVEKAGQIVAAVEKLLVPV